ncbi:alkaline phosphatase family protein [Terriglobus saanensis]|uniref:Type I phosphodiesterase/nucleotide pyrophosphatase n=1 Tax=Terriglobus saanensis (strain ATCC BAA-1853 / DSM 23119 / SP1PR4) TaxID=401053 RepID=E8V3K2_TERSS|nr:ectonucleotide pyrophosphatase/phosphodiesterase [Terriglobus saanensis]ADV83615.1 type I phosphodiesterase/nucleotide pyrophosphatase [Terriglobus saanensis SP1PR4]
MRYLFLSTVIASTCLLAGSLFAQTRSAPVVLISIDGMKPEYVIEADAHHLRIPVLRTFITQGTYATGVVGVVPTVTYPSHTTMVTGVWPAEHGVLDNTVFDPLQQHPNTWYWDFADIKVPTLYTAADAAGLKTANVGWPVTIGAPIDYNIAEGTQSEHTDRPSGSPYHPADILEQIDIHLVKETDQDVTKTAEAVAILRKFKPDLTLVHLTDMDHQEHEHSPFSAEANASLEGLDRQIGQIRDAALAADPRAILVVVSDHGFLSVDHRVNLNVLLAGVGLIQVGAIKAGTKKPTITSWQAEAWPAGGSNAIVLSHPNDPVLVARVRQVLEAAKADPSNGIATILTHDEIVARGGFPNATFLVDYRDGFDPGNAFSGAVVQDAPSTGMHGYLPSRPAMWSAFLIQGQGIAAGRNLGVVDMRQIAPTIAQLLSIALPAAKLSPLNVR